MSAATTLGASSSNAGHCYSRIGHGKVGSMTAETFRPRKAGLFPMDTALLWQVLRGAYPIIPAFLLVLGPIVVGGQPMAAARATTTTNAPAWKPVDSVTHAKISLWKPILDRKSVE